MAAPTDTGDGTYYYTHVDLRVWDDADFKFTRIYNSVDTRPGPLGPGWTHSFNVRLFHETQDGQDVVRVIGSYAKTVYFTPLPDGRFKARGSEAGTLVQHQDGPFKDTYELVAPGGTRFELDPDGRAFQITYPNKTTVGLTYDQADRLQTVVTRDGSRSLTFSYQGDGERLVSVRDWLDPAREIRFDYDERGRLASFADRLGAVTHYTYHDETNWLKQVVNARGHAEQTLEYHPNGWIKKLSGARDLQAGLGTTVEHESLDDGAPRTTMISPPSAFAPDSPTVLIDTYDADIRLVRREWNLGPDDEPLIEEYGYDQRSKRVASPVFGGRTTPTDDGAQCVMAARLPGVSGVPRVGAELRRTLVRQPKPAMMPLDRQAADELDFYDEAYDEAGRLTELFVEHVDGEWSERWKLAFDAEDHVVSLIVTPNDDRPEQKTLFRYDVVGNLVEKTGPNGEVTRYEYDADDALVVEQEIGGATTRYAYDAQGYLARMTKTGPDGIDAQVVEYAHDGAGRLRRVVDHQETPDGLKTATTELSYRQYTLSAICQTGSAAAPSDSQTGPSRVGVAPAYDVGSGAVR